MLVFYGGCADLMRPSSTYLCKKRGPFYQELRDLGPLYFVSSTGNLGPARAKRLQNGGLRFLHAQSAKIRDGIYPQNGFQFDGYEHNF